MHRVARLRNDRGAVAVIVAIVMVVLLGAAALAIDAGNLWSLRRDLITATDASALAGASYLLRNGSAACSSAVASGPASPAGGYATNQLTSNQASATLDATQGFVVYPYNNDCTSGAGKVSVLAYQPASLVFAPSIGLNGSQSVVSSSIAEYGSLVATGGLRPIGICQDAANIQQWENAPGFAATGQDPDQNSVYRALAGSGPNYLPASTYPGANNGTGQIDVVSHIDFTKLNSADCGSSPGNWGWLNFAGGGVNALNGWLRNGFNQARPPNYIYTGETGAHAGSADSALNSILCAPTTPTQNCNTFGVVVYSVVKGPGANAKYTGVAQLCVALRGFQNVTGNSGSFDLEFLAPTRCSLGGTIGLTNNPLALRGVALCGGGYAATVDDKCDV
jgi:hypothetical protein